MFGRIADARSSLLNASSVEDKVEASNQLERGIRDLKVVVENYPELRSNESVTRLMDELAGTENRIRTERARYNETVADYNRKIKRFPTVIIAGMMGFDEREYFKSADDADKPYEFDFAD